jgi:hypothetical protein
MLTELSPIAKLSPVYSKCHFATSQHGDHSHLHLNYSHVKLLDVTQTNLTGTTLLMSSKLGFSNTY